MSSQASSTNQQVTVEPALFDKKLLENKVGIITGSSSGIGLGIAQFLSRHGAKVTLCGRDEEKLAKAADTVEGEVLTTSGDVRDLESVKSGVASHMERFGRLDFLINNAAGNFLCPLEQLSDNGFRSVIDIVLTGSFHFSQAVLPQMKKQGGGCILNTGTTYAFSHGTLVGHSGAAKAGVLNLTKTMAVEWAPYGIRSNMICPGPVKGTEGVKRLMHNEAVMKYMMEIMPIPRMAEPWEIGAIAAFLLSPLASYINGAVIPVDGGLHLVNPGLLPPQALKWMQNSSVNPKS